MISGEKVTCQKSGNSQPERLVEGAARRPGLMASLQRGLNPAAEADKGRKFSPAGAGNRLDGPKGKRRFIERLLFFLLIALGPGALFLGSGQEMTRQSASLRASDPAGAVVAAIFPKNAWASAPAAATCSALSSPGLDGEAEMLIPLPPGSDLLAPAAAFPPPSADIQQRERALALKEAELASREEALKALDADLRRRHAASENFRGKLEAALAELEALRKMQRRDDEINRGANIRHLAAAYGAMKPEQAGALVNNLDEEVAAAIFSAMSGRKAGLILANVMPEKAARLTKAISEGRAAPLDLLGGSPAASGGPEAP